MPQLSLPFDGRVDDTEAIPNHKWLWRLVDPEAIKEDAQTGERVPSDGDFRTHELSVRMETATFMLDDLKRENPGAEVVRFSAKQAREVGCIVTLDRKEFDGSHAFVYRKDNPGKRPTGSQASRLSRGSQII